MNNIELLLKQSYAVDKRYKEIARISGVNFNIFKTLEIQEKELSHSKILRTLLDPKGDHGQGNIFLELFLAKILGIELNENELNTIRVIKEYTTNFGRLDIYIYNDSISVIIENKIYAEDQGRQIERYANYLTESSSNKKNAIIYLTLYGKEPSEQSIGKLSVEKQKELLLCRSYSRDILDWLELCQKECHNFPVLHETLTQYINTVKVLTGQAWSKQMENEILDLLSADADSIQSSLRISSLLPKLQYRLIKENLLSPLETAAYKLDMEMPPSQFKIFDKWFGFNFRKSTWKSGIFIRFEFGGPAGTFSNFYYGIWGKNEELATRLKDFNDQQDGSHILLKRLSGYGDWVSDNIFPKLVSKQNEVVDIIVEKIQEILALLKTKAGDIEL